METFLAFLVLIGILVWVHELGHFTFAKLFGVKVEVFSIGFGPPIIQKRWGETVYQIALLPLGGYVKLYGEEDDEEARRDPRSFYAKPPWQRILIAAAGPLFNFLFAILVFWVVFLKPQEVPAYLLKPPVVERVEPGSLAEKVGLKPGDRIVAVDGKPVRSWEELDRLLRWKVGEEVVLTVERNGKPINLKVRLSFDVLAKGLGLEQPLPPVVGRVLEGSPAQQVGLKPGDRILEVNGVPVEDWRQLVKLIRENGSKPLTLKVERDGKVFTVTVVPEVKKLPDGREVPILGIAPKVEFVEKKLSPLEALKAAVEQTLFLSYLTLKTLWGLITGEVSIKTLGGPIAIADFAGEAAKAGLWTFLSAMGVLSVQLGLFNLLPLPVLDGGMIVLTLIEWIWGRPLPKTFKEWWFKIGFALIVSFMIFIIVQDLVRLLTTGEAFPR
ncbi:MAG: RIP metalloprotease RseP [Aquificae bacterium]|nr:RIP metalloprotease RseP [Aquificota bacterium]